MRAGSLLQLLLPLATALSFLTVSEGEAEVCVEDPVASASELPLIHEWTDRDALAYCTVNLHSPVMCQEVDPMRLCTGAIREFAPVVVVRVDAFIVADGKLFGRVKANNSCVSEPVVSFLKIEEMNCVFRPRWADE